MDEWGLARLIGYIGGGAAFWLFTRRRESRNATPDHSFGRRVLRDAVRPPAYPGIPMDQDADTPDGTVASDEQVNERFHAPIRAWVYTKENDR